MIVALEGIDGSGKTTIGRMLAERLCCPFQVFPDRSTPIGKKLDLMMKAGREHIDPLIFQALQTMNRVECWAALTLPLVVCDRYIASAYVYGAADGLDQATLRDLNAFLPSAALHILLRPPTEVCHARVKARRQDDAYGQRKLGEMAHLQYLYDSLWNDHHGDSPGAVTWWKVLRVQEDTFSGSIVDECVRLVDAYLLAHAEA